MSMEILDATGRMRAFQRRIGEYIFHLENRALGALAHIQKNILAVARRQFSWALHRSFRRTA
jgi:hypothetical protein